MESQLIGLLQKTARRVTARVSRQMDQMQPGLDILLGTLSFDKLQTGVPHRLSVASERRLHIPIKGILRPLFSPNAGSQHRGQFILSQGIALFRFCSQYLQHFIS